MGKRKRSSEEKTGELSGRDSAEECERASPAPSFQGVSDEESSSSRERLSVFSDAVAPDHGGRRCPRFPLPSHWRRSGRWGKMKEKVTRRG